jgi:hypothetical protein
MTMVTKITLKNTGKNFTKYRVKNIKIVILNPLTAIRWVSHELLKSLCISFGIFSLAHKRIHASNSASFWGY